jgi:hypothetical protein
MVQGDLKMGPKGTISIFVVTHEEILHILPSQRVTYARIVVDFWPQKVDPHRIWITIRENLINYPGELSTRTVDITTSILMWNSILSTERARYMFLDLIFFYLSAPLDQYKYMKIQLALFPNWIKKQYNLDSLALDGFVFFEMCRAIWGLPQAGILVNKLLGKRLFPHGYYGCVNTPSLWKHSTHPITFTLVVDNFGVKYVGKEHADHLIQSIKKDYELTKDWMGPLYCGIQLVWDYNAQTLDISMLGYIINVLQK